MEPSGVERKLTTILSADVEGYSRLMGEDEEATLRTLNAYREVIDGLIAEHRGRVFASAGDSVVAEFASAVEAVRCAVDIQQELEKRNADLPQDRRMRFRIGVNLGDVMVEGDNLLGDGVNVAARLQELGEPGGVCVSGDVYRQVEGKLALGYEDLGEQTVKNIAKPVRAYRVEVVPSQSAKASGDQGPDALPLPDKPSIAVLPFTNMSGDPEQEYFSDGITEDIITGLSRFRELFVIARNSAFTYKGRSAKVQDIGRELGVQYVVEGSVRRAGKRIRVTAQLVDAASGNHLWADRYDREMEDIFAVQDEVTETVVATLAGRLGDIGVERMRRKTTESLTAFDHVLQARQQIYLYRRESILKARELLERAVVLDPDYATAHAWLSKTYRLDWWAGWASDPKAWIESAAELAAKAVALDDTDTQAHMERGLMYLSRRQYDEARFHVDKAESLNPNHPDAAMTQAFYNMYVGNPEQAIAKINHAIRIDPLGHYGFILGMIHYSARNYEQAIAAFKTVRAEFQAVLAWLAASHAHLGNDAEAQSAATKFLRRATDAMTEAGAPHPGNWSEFFAQRWPYKRQEDLDHFLDGLRKAGLE